MKRILFFVHYNKYNGLADYVLYLLEHIKHLYSRIVFISNSPLSGEQRDRLAPFCSDIILRENRGFDFGAWKDALLREGWEDVAQYDSVTLMNDTCFGPFFDLDPVYNKMEQEKVDFWGLTLHQKTSSGMSGTDDSIPEHIQPCFLCFKNSVTCSPIFRNFWQILEYYDDKNKVIQKCGARITVLLSDAGFKYTALYSPALNPDVKNKDAATWHPDIVLANNVPFIKIKSFICFSYQKYIIDLIQKKNYPVGLIYDHITEIYNPNASIQVCNKLIPAISGAGSAVTIKIAIHIHVFYLDVFEQYLYYFNLIMLDFDLFVTTDTTDKKNQILAALGSTNTAKRLKGIIITENRGRDVMPWLGLADILAGYDVVGHFHTKKTPSVENYIGETWQQEIFELLLNPINRIIDEFQKNMNVGIIIPDIPYYAQVIKPFLSKNNKHKMAMRQLWKKMKMKEDIDFDRLDSLIMPYGNMFWYRPEALQPLFDLHFTPNDFPPEPLEEDFTLAHCLEWLQVYIAWGAGYDYRIMVFCPQKTSGFTHNMAIAKFQKVINELEHSKTYRTGQFILAIPKMIKRVFSGR